MFLRPFRPAQFLQSVCGTEPFADYCRERAIPFEHRRSARPATDATREWTTALGRLPTDRRAQVERELATVNEMAGEDALSHLLDATSEAPRPPANLPGGAPLALWVLLRHPQTFHEVYLHHEIEEVDRWHVGRGSPGREVAIGGVDPFGLFAEELRAFFVKAGYGRSPCVVEACPFGSSRCIVAYLGDRTRLLHTFTEGGDIATQRLRPARTVIFLYEPDDGTVLLSSHLRSRERVASLLSIFGRTVLGCLVVPVDQAHDLDILKRPFRGLPDAPDMESVRVKSLHLRYPAREGRRQVRLDTVSTDAPSAIERLLHAHVSARDLAWLRVSFAELQVRMRTAVGSKTFPIRLWPDRSNLGETELGDRFRACLKRWGLLHAR